MELTLDLLAAWDRLATLAEAHGMSVADTINRLIDADPHDHQHRCPTCVRLEARAIDPEDEPLFVMSARG